MACEGLPRKSDLEKLKRQSDFIAEVGTGETEQGVPIEYPVNPDTGVVTPALPQLIDRFQDTADAAIAEYKLKNRGNYLPNPVTLEDGFEYVRYAGDGKDYFAVTPPYTTDPTTYPDPSLDANLVSQSYITRGAAEQLTNAGDSQIAGLIYPVNANDSLSTSSPNNDIPLDTVLVRDAFTGTLYRTDPVKTGIVSALNFPARTATIGGDSVTLVKFSGLVNESEIVAARAYYDLTGVKSRIDQRNVIFTQGFEYPLDHLMGTGSLLWNGKVFDIGKACGETDIFDPGYWIAKMNAGVAVKIGCIGDSTTDGFPTTGHIDNAFTLVMGEKVPDGNNNHTDEDLYAWPTVMREMLRSYHNNATIEVFNGGYGGQFLSTPNIWPYKYFEKIFIDNPFYGVPDLCLISFGLNDATGGATDTPDAFLGGLEALTYKIKGYGGTPVVLTTDPTIASDTRARVSQEQLNAQILEYCKTNNLMCIDVQHESQKFWSNNSVYKWYPQIVDDVHNSDPHHGFKGGLCTRMLSNNVLRLRQNQEAVSILDKHFHNQAAVGRTIDETKDLRFGGFANYMLVGDRKIGELWVWADSHDYEITLRDFGFPYTTNPTATNQLCNIYVNEAPSWISGAKYIDVIHADGAKEMFYFPQSESPAYIGRLRQGLNRITIIAPDDAISAVNYFGYLQFNKTTISSKDSLYEDVAQRSGFQTVATLPPRVFTYHPNFDGVNTVYTPEREDWTSRNIVSFANAGDECQIQIVADIDDDTGLILMDGGTQSGRSGIALFKTNVGTIQLFEYSKTKGDTGSGAFISLGSGASGITGDTEYRVIFNTAPDGLSTQIRVFVGFDTTVPAIDVTTHPTDPLKAWRTSGTFGGLWTGAGVPTAEISAKVRSCIIKSK